MYLYRLFNSNDSSDLSANSMFNFKKCCRMILCLELFIVMGLNWSAEIISSRLSNPQTENVWFVTDLGNALQGVSIFVIFVCRERVLKLLNLQCCPRLRLFESSGPPPRQPKPVNNYASSNPTVTFKLYDIHFTDENEMINQQNPENRHLLNGARPEWVNKILHGIVMFKVNFLFIFY